MTAPREVLVSDEDVLEKMAYTIANPTAAGLVRSPRDWPGVITTRIGERCTVQTPFRVARVAREVIPGRVARPGTGPVRTRGHPGTGRTTIGTGRTTIARA